MKNIAVFCDVGNLFYCIGRKYPGRKVDYKKYLDTLAEDNNLFRAYAYGSQAKNEAAKFIACLQHIGFDVKYRQMVQNKRVDWSVGLAMDVVRIINKVDTIFIGSSDQDLIPLIVWIKEQGVRVIVVACGIGHAIRDAADDWVELDQSMLEEEAVDGRASS